MKLLYGSQNFGYNTPQSDKDWMCFVYPTWNDVVNNNVKSVETVDEDGCATKIKDIRLIMKMIKKCNFSDLQILYSQEMYGCEDLSWFIQNRDRLVKNNMAQLYKTNCGYITSCLKKKTDKGLIRAMSTAQMVCRAFDNEEFVMLNTNLASMRLDVMNKQEMYTNYIHETLSK